MFNPLSKVKNTSLALSNTLWVILISILLGIVLFIFSSHVLMKPHLATVDITGIVQQFVQSQASLNVPPSVLRKRVNHFGQQLEKTLQTLAHEKHFVILPQEAVLAGSLDLTPLVKQRLHAYQALSTE